jgi:hypothetical protein
MFAPSLQYYEIEHELSNKSGELKSNGFRLLKKKQKQRFTLSQ